MTATTSPKNLQYAVQESAVDCASDSQAQIDNLEPLHRTIIMIDVANFSDRDNRTQLLIRDRIYRILGRAFLESGVNWTTWIREDRGDGMLIIIPPEVSKARLLGPFPSVLAALLRDHTQTHCSAEFRLRMVIHAGDIVQDNYGHSGSALNLTAHLLNAPVLRVALARTGAPLALATSEIIYENIVRHGYSNIDPTSYQHAKVNVKGTRTSLWIHVPAVRPPLRGITQSLSLRAAAKAGILTLVAAASLIFNASFNSSKDWIPTDDCSPTQRSTRHAIYSTLHIGSAVTTQRHSAENSLGSQGTNPPKNFWSLAINQRTPLSFVQIPQADEFDRELAGGWP